MQWDGSKNAGFSSAAKTWLPVHPGYEAINVESETKDEGSLLNTIRALLGIRKQHEALQGGSLKLVDGLPDDVFGYHRKSGSDEISVVLNFSQQPKQFKAEGGDCIFKLSERDGLVDGDIRLSEYGGMILRS
jgi:glucan 1,6-alpha-glucosidase